MNIDDDAHQPHASFLVPPYILKWLSSLGTLSSVDTLKEQHLMVFLILTQPRETGTIRHRGEKPAWFSKKNACLIGQEGMSPWAVLKSSKSMSMPSLASEIMPHN